MTHRPYRRLAMAEAFLGGVTWRGTAGARQQGWDDGAAGEMEGGGGGGVDVKKAARVPAGG